MEFLINLFSSFGIFTEAFIATYTISIVLKILLKKKESVSLEKLIYCALCIFVVYLFNQIIFGMYPSYASLKWIISIIFIPLFINYFLESNYLTSLLSLIIGMLIAAIIEMLFSLLLAIFGIQMISIRDNLILKVLFLLFMKIVEFSLMYLVHSIYLKKNRLSSDSSFVKYMIPQFLALSICLFPIMTFMVSNSYGFSITFLIINLCQLLVITIVSLYNINNVVKQKDTEFKLANTIIHNETLLKVNDGVRGFKHDMSNIVQAIIGYMAVGDMEGAKKFCQNLVNGFNDINVLSILSPEIVNDPAIYGVIVNKILIAREKEMSLSLDINLNVSEINFPKFELSRILGILIDNAIEAGEKTTDKKLILDMHNDYNTNQSIIKIANSIENLDIDINRVYEKDYSTKQNPSGFGLYEVKKFLSKYTQGRIYTKIDNDKKLFCQTIYIDKSEPLKEAM